MVAKPKGQIFGRTGRLSPFGKRPVQHGLSIEASMLRPAVTQNGPSPGGVRETMGSVRDRVRAGY